MIPAETRRNFDDFNNMYREIELEIGETDEIQYAVVDRVESELNQRRLRDVLRWCDGDHYLEAVGYEFEDFDDDYGSDDSGSDDYGSDDSGCSFDFDGYVFDLDGDVFVFGASKASDPGYGSDISEVSDIED